MYVQYALGTLQEQFTKDSNDGQFSLAPCTYVPLPRTGQVGLCRVLGSSANDM